VCKHSSVSVCLREESKLQVFRPILMKSPSCTKHELQVSGKCLGCVTSSAGLQTMSTTMIFCHMLINIYFLYNSKCYLKTQSREIWVFFWKTEVQVRWCYFKILDALLPLFLLLETCLFVEFVPRCFAGHVLKLLWPWSQELLNFWCIVSDKLGLIK